MRHSVHSHKTLACLLARHSPNKNGTSPFPKQRIPDSVNINVYFQPISAITLPSLRFYPRMRYPNDVQQHDKQLHKPTCPLIQSNSGSTVIIKWCPTWQKNVQSGTIFHVHPHMVWAPKNLSHSRQDTAESLRAHNSAVTSILHTYQV